MKDVRCMRCGFGDLKKTETGYKCLACGANFSDGTVEKEVEALEEIVSGAFAKQELEKIAKSRVALNEELGRDHPDRQVILPICQEIKKYLPHDFRANFYEMVSSDYSGKANRINKFLDKIDVTEQRDFIPEVLYYMIKDLKEDYIESVGRLLERAYDKEVITQKEHTDIRKKYEEMVNRVYSGWYDPYLTRDAIILYSHKDKEEVEKLLAHLEKELDFKCFVAYRNVQSGIGSNGSYYDTIFTAAQNCRAVIMVSTVNSRSRKCQATELEIPWIQENLPDIPRIEYLIGKSYEASDAGAKRVRNFFKSRFYQEDVESVGKALSEIVDKAVSREVEKELHVEIKGTPKNDVHDTVYIDSEENLTSGEEEFNLPEFTDVSDDENDGKQIKSKRTKGEKTIENIDKETRKKEFWGESHNAFLFVMCVMFAIASVALLFPGTQLFSILAIASGMVTIVTAIIALGSVGDDIAYIEVEVGTLIFFGVVAVVTVIVGLVQWIGLYGII